MRTVTFASLLFISLAVDSWAAEIRAFPSTPIKFATASEKFFRTELYFGRNIPTGGIVSESDWQKFVDEAVTPRFPGGMTVLDADGHGVGRMV